MASGIIHSIKHGAVFGVKHNTLVLGGSITRDGPQNVMMPASLAEWQAVGGGIAVPDAYFPVQESSGDLVDEVLGATMVDAASPSYEQTITDWERFFVSTPTETAGMGWSSAALWNMNTQSVVILGYFRLTSASTTRIAYLLAGTNAYISFIGTGRIRLNNSISNTGTVDYQDGLVHPFLVEYHLTDNVWRLSTDKEQIVGTWELISDGDKSIGGLGGLTPPVCDYGPLVAWVGADAETIIDNGPKATLEHLGWTVTGY